MRNYSFLKLPDGSGYFPVQVVSNVFSKLDGFQKYCSITADEIHVKPSLQFQKENVIEFVADIDYPCVAKTVLATHG